jgi:hypothetical protein
MAGERIRCRACPRSHGEDAPQILDRSWPH